MAIQLERQTASIGIDADPLWNDPRKIIEDLSIAIVDRFNANRDISNRILTVRENVEMWHEFKQKVNEGESFFQWLPVYSKNILTSFNSKELSIFSTRILGAVEAGIIPDDVEIEYAKRAAYFLDGFAAQRAVFEDTLGIFTE